ncbi:8179_t:CDS:1 [Paraglomus occultum]|uniref:8179_t:CDS:1 n=1 Tax=Paraglomus occultum TaxID=144539 RepID=A0A9N9G050_9GLOM|nr:8179_t:CDS:1 [Paraglomus occultum]
MKNEKYQELLRKLFDELETRIATTFIDFLRGHEKYLFLASAVYPFKSQIKIAPERTIEGKNGQGNLDYGMESHRTGRIIGLVEVKKDDFKQQTESSLTCRKRKTNEIEDEHDVGKLYQMLKNGSWNVR